jgi:hypothetical protein
MTVNESRKQNTKTRLQLEVRADLRPFTQRLCIITNLQEGIKASWKTRMTANSIHKLRFITPLPLIYRERNTSVLWTCVCPSLVTFESACMVQCWRYKSPGALRVSIDTQSSDCLGWKWSNYDSSECLWPPTDTAYHLKRPESSTTSLGTSSLH